MCRFVAFKGKERVVLNKILNESSNSLIAQSRLAKETRTGVNADGFGIGWYETEIDPNPGIFKSIQPAWNDHNLISICSKVRSNCFMGHIRASTVGEVNISNCHPFTYKQFLFAHNGTIDHFDKIKKSLLMDLDEEYFSKIKGQTDSEHFFFLVCNIIEKELGDVTAETMAQGLTLGIQKLDQLLDRHHLEHEYRINAVLTNGHEIVALRYTSDRNKAPHSLYFSKNEAVIIASECLSHGLQKWVEIPVNTILTVDKELNTTLQHVSLFANKTGEK